MAGDLHTHTTFSDGSCHIELLPHLAARAGLGWLAVADHDTLLAVQYAERHPVQAGVRLIPAAELTCRDEKRGRRAHILCYCPRATPGLKAFTALMARRRNEAARASIQRLEAMYPQFSGAAARLFAARGGVVFKAHLMRVLMECGYAASVYGEAFRRLLGTGGAVLYETPYEPLDTVLALIKEAGGVAVLAHPSVYRSMELAGELAAAGRIDGVEIDHPRNTEEDKRTLRELAARHGLIVTGGSDFHGMYMSRPAPLGACATEDGNIRRILALAQQRRGG